MISPGRPTNSIQDVLDITTEVNIASYYLGINSIPIVIKSPLRIDNNPSFGIFSPDGIKVKYIDFSTKDKGDIFTLLMNMWNVPLNEVCKRICDDFSKFKGDISVTKSAPSCHLSGIGKYSDSELKCKVREWRNYDIEYWASYGVSLPWLKYAEVYPISHKIVIKNGKRYVFGAAKYAYAFVESKDGKVTLKIYQPYGGEYKWANSMDRTVWSLWSKIPKQGDNLIIGSSLKDCLNLWSNTGIPAICLQGEGYEPEESSINELKSRYKNIIVFYDNDFNSSHNAGREDSLKMASKFDLKRAEIPEKYKCKDPSDLYKTYGKEKYMEIINSILKDLLWKKSGEI